MPEAAAGPPSVVFSTSKPSFTGKSSASLSQPLTGHVSTPRNARCTRPSVIRSLAIFFANDLITDGRVHRAFLGVETRSEEHTSELQSHLNLVCRLLLEKKKQR